MNTLSYGNAPWSQSIERGQLNVTVSSSLYASSGLVTMPCVVEQPELSAFLRVSRPDMVDSSVQYTICTPAVTSTVPLQSPSVHWKKRLTYEYVQPDTGLAASTHVAPAIHSGYMRPQTSNVYLPDMSVDKGHSMTSVEPPQAPPPPSSYVSHGHMMPLQVPTVPSALPPPSHLPL